MTAQRRRKSKLILPACQIVTSRCHAAAERAPSNHVVFACQDARDGVPQTVGYSVSPFGDNLLASSVASAARGYSGGGDSASTGGGGPDPPSGVLPMPTALSGAAFGASGPLHHPPYVPAAAEPFVSSLPVPGIHGSACVHKVCMHGLELACNW